MPTSEVFSAATLGLAAVAHIWPPLADSVDGRMFPQSPLRLQRSADRAAECPPAWLLCPDRSVEDRKNQSSSQQCGTRLLWCHQGSCKTKIHPSSPVVLVIGGTSRVVIFAECTILLLLMVAAPRHGVRTTTSPVTSNLYQPPDLLTPSNSTLVF